MIPSRQSEFLTQQKTFQVHLFQPDIPQNTGNIGRLCVGSHCHLHLIGPIGFRLDTKAVRRAGLDYWEHLRWTYHDSPEVWEASLSENFFLFSIYGKKNLYEASFPLGSHLIFGSETRGLPKSLLEKYADRVLFIPMVPECRSMNLANAVSVAVYEAIRQQFYTSVPSQKSSPC
ncbi:MAG: tRNA (cytidine(34)-2'-O)-methyltransferase [Planctomycetota bacterium]